MLKIRLKRVGRRHDATFRMVVVESSRSSKSGSYIENLGTYDPRQDSKNINAERVNHWLEVGALPSDTVHNLLVEIGVITGKKVNVLPKKTPQGEGEGKEEATTESTDKEALTSPAEESSAEEEKEAETNEEEASEDEPSATEEENTEESTTAEKAEEEGSSEEKGSGENTESEVAKSEEKVEDDEEKKDS
ncbi:MAG: 30S ribosomal protein S16 [Candidatus Campbellbacteria bacterium]|nr:30S ribosomal protein S16 [Candidatus Campbellbacteria bacterium]